MADRAQMADARFGAIRNGEHMAKADRKKNEKRPSSGAGDEGASDEASRPQPLSRSWLVEWIKTLVFALVLFLFLRTFVIESFVITSGSMEDTMLVGDFLLVNKMGLGSPVPGTALRVPGYNEPERGDIVVFRADHAPGLDIVKRVAAIPGDTVWMKGGVLHRNGERVDEPYVTHDSAIPNSSSPTMDWQLAHLAPGVDRSRYKPTRDDWGPLVIPEERYFMMGDNREHSLDSRHWGLVERKKMKGTPFFVYYSYDEDAVKPFPWVLAMRPGRIGPSPD